MKIVNTGIKYQVYDDSLRTFDNLPAGTYCVRFTKLTGFYLESRPNMQVTEAVYGPHEAKVQKVMASFKQFPRSLGVILSGAKGIGKSMFARLLSSYVVAAGMPVIIVDTAYPGIAAYLESIEQEAMILFDEFDKTFSRTSDEPDPQASMLSLFDGTANGKRLFVVTCNNLKNLNDFLVNRPGRFHYHFRFDYPTADEIRTYMQDKLKPEYYDQIDPVIAFAARVDLNYDCLRAIAFELNTGTPFAEAIKDLNIVNVETPRYDIILSFANGMNFTYYNTRVDLFDPAEEIDYNFTDKNLNYIGRVIASVSDVQYDYNTNTPFIPGDKVNLMFSSYDNDGLDDDERETVETINRLKQSKIASLSFHRVMDKSLHYAV